MAKLTTSVTLAIVEADDATEVIGQLKFVNATGYDVLPAGGHIVSIANGDTTEFYPAYLTGGEKVEFMFKINYAANVAYTSRYVGVKWDAAVAASIGGYFVGGVADSSVTINNTSGQTVTVEFVATVAAGI